MMRAILATAVFCLSLCFADSAANAFWTSDVAAPTQRSTAPAHRYHHAAAFAFTLPKPPPIARTVNRIVGPFAHLSAQCRHAAALGGPCGCFAAELYGLPHNYHGFNLWLADDWAKAFQRAAPGPGMAAVWPHRHVAKIDAVQGNRALFHDSWGQHWGSTVGLIVVDPSQPAHRHFARL